jgi:hypothetical protein
MQYTSLVNRDFLVFIWYVEQQSLLLHSSVPALQLTLILKQHFSNQNSELQQETPAQHCN